MKQTVFVLHNDELGYMDPCPVFTDRKDAETEAAFKCRKHSVKEVDNNYSPCHPMIKTSMCDKCAIYKK